ncbi:MAG: tRNA (adenosine(37)-N6)-threonylcarbamoyltransferase complex dimerization subunit type 1 TsaB [Clostridia bacterium]|nr:tRNA (adenosine(37)-N6)-threonylcarbamoyltransferase complex dimerization subunit type 1 TsaB [Clostridia bacterium]
MLNGEKEHIYVGNQGARRHTSEILTQLDVLLAESGVKARELDYVGVVVGPGSFTGIRIGTSTANAIAMASGAKIVELTELEAMICDRDSALAMIDCKHDNYYCLLKSGDTLEYMAKNISELSDITLERVIYSEPIPQKLIATFLRKVESQTFSAVAKPYYMKKSSAEA